MSWKAHVEIMSGHHGPEIEVLRNVEARVDGDSMGEAIAGAEYIMNALAKGKLAYIRVWPEADKWLDFDANRIDYRGYVRFSVSTREGEWVDRSREATSRSFSTLPDQKDAAP